MQNSQPRKSLFILVYLFLGFTILFGIGWLTISWTVIDSRVLLTGNLLLFAVSICSFRLGSRALHHKNVQVFLRMVYSSLLLKLFLPGIAAFIYIAGFKQNVNKPALFGCFGLYLIYTFTEVRLVMQQSKQKNA